jgi:hypothetical protein
MIVKKCLKTWMLNTYVHESLMIFYGSFIRGEGKNDAIKYKYIDIVTIYIIYKGCMREKALSDTTMMFLFFINYTLLAAVFIYLIYRAAVFEFGRPGVAASSFDSSIISSIAAHILNTSALLVSCN